MLPSLSHILGKKIQQLIKDWPGFSGLAGVMQDKLIFLKHLRITLLNSCIHIDSKSVGKHQEVFALLAGIFNQRPPQPSYIFIWDVDRVLYGIRTHWYENPLLTARPNL